MICTRCSGEGFLNLEQIPDDDWEAMNAAANDGHELKGCVLNWIEDNVSDVQVCDCCGNGENWYGEPGHHSYNYGPGAVENLEPFPECG